jgi:hypothetical protein
LARIRFVSSGQDRRGSIVLRQKWSRGQVEARLANDHESYDRVSMYHCCGSAPERNRAGTSRASESASARAKAQAAERWCLRTESGGSDCGFHSLAQCNETRAGNAYSFCWRSRRAHKGTPGS